MSTIHEQTILRIKTVLERINAHCANDPETADMYADCLDEMLTNMQNSDAFGTEGQCDPRGDQRNGEFAMDHVEGIDD